jgi:hypothetical protein
MTSTLTEKQKTNKDMNNGFKDKMLFGFFVAVFNIENPVIATKKPEPVCNISSHQLIRTKNSATSPKRRAASIKSKKMLSIKSGIFNLNFFSTNEGPNERRIRITDCNAMKIFLLISAPSASMNIPNMLVMNRRNIEILNI